MWNKMAFVDNDWSFLNKYDLPQETIKTIKDTWTSNHKAWFSLDTYLMTKDARQSELITLNISIDNIPALLKVYKYNRKTNPFRVIVRDTYNYKNLCGSVLSSSKEAVIYIKEVCYYRFMMGELLPPSDFGIKYNVYQVFNHGRDDEDACCVCQEPSRGFRTLCGHATCFSCFSKITYMHDADDDSEFEDEEPVFKCPSCRKRQRFEY